MHSPRPASPLVNPSAGTALIWALMIAMVLITVAASLAQSAHATQRSARSTGGAALRAIEDRNALTYTRRLLEAGAAPLMAGAPNPVTDAAAIAQILQQRADGWCGRDPDGHGPNRVRVYFTRTACGSSLPNDIPLDQVRITPASGAYLAEIPFVLWAGTGQHRRGLVTAHYGSPPANAYTLLTASDLTLSARLQVNGRVHSDGTVNLVTGAQARGTISSSNCLAVSATCTGAAQAGRDGTATGVMELRPSPGHPAGVDAFFTSRQASETANLVTAAPAAISVTADQLTLGVLGDGGQWIRACSQGVCTTYSADASGTLYQDGYLTNPVYTMWSGVLRVTSVTGALQISPHSNAGPAISQPLSILTDQPVTVTGALRYAQATCAADVCNAAAAAERFSLHAPSIQVADTAPILHGTYVAPVVTVQGPLFVFGSLVGSPTLTGPASLTLTGDDRALQGLAAPAVGRLHTGWRHVAVSVSP